MVLESLITPKRAEKQPWRLIFLGIIYSVIAFIFAMAVFAQSASIVAVFLIVICSVPLMYKIIKIEEQKDLKIIEEYDLLKEHSRAIAVFMFLFLGMVIAITTAYIFLPQDVQGKLFSLQISTITDINGGVTEIGQASNITGNATSFDVFIHILLNNIKVLIYCLIFAFLFGAGAIFILTWNASVIGTALGGFIRDRFSEFAASMGNTNLAIYFSSVSLGLLRYSIHGVPEILAYFIAGLAGGIISVAAINHNFKTNQFYRIVFDSSGLILISILVLVVAAILEVYVTPIFF